MAEPAANDEAEPAANDEAEPAVNQSEAASLTATEVADLDGLDDWTYVLGSLQAVFGCSSMAEAAALVTAIVDQAGPSGHQPQLDLREPGDVRARLQTEAVGQVTMLDVEAARSISALAQAVGAQPASPAPTVQELEIAFDTMDSQRIRPFWQAVLDYHYLERFDALVDPRGQGPSVWFQQMDEPRAERNRIHFDITVAPAEAEPRVAAAVAAGGTLVSDRRARAFWVLADPEGNEICICTWQDRD